MSSTDWAYLAALTPANFQNGGHRTYFVPALNAVAASASDVSALATQVASNYNLVIGAYGLMLQVSGGALGVGTDQLDVPLRNMLGSAAYADIEHLIGCRAVTVNADLAIVPTDFGRKMLLTTSGTRTYTLPAWSNMPTDPPRLPGKNRSGNNLTLAPGSASDAINGGTAGASLTIATGLSYDVVWSETANNWEVRTYS